VICWLATIWDSEKYLSVFSDDVLTVALWIKPLQLFETTRSLILSLTRCADNYCIHAMSLIQGERPMIQPMPRQIGLIRHQAGRV
jgi:hypothetical protein